jgi:hypothetical protein
MPMRMEQPDLDDLARRAADLLKAEYGFSPEEVEVLKHTARVVISMRTAGALGKVVFKTFLMIGWAIAGLLMWKNGQLTAFFSGWKP